MLNTKAYSQDFQTGVLENWIKFQAGEPIPSTALRKIIYDSWMRSKQGQALPSKISPPKLSASELQYTLRKERLLLECSRSIMDKVLSSIQPSAATFTIANAQGIILHSISNSVDLEDFPYLLPGCSAREEDAGTNGLGTCLVEKLPIQIIGYEHYNEKSHGWSCSASPTLA